MCQKSIEGFAPEEACPGLGYGFVIFGQKHPLFMGVDRGCFGESQTILRPLPLRGPLNRLVLFPIH